MNWYEREMERLDEEYAQGMMTQQEYLAAQRELNAALREEAADAAQDAYDNVMGF